MVTQTIYNLPKDPKVISGWAFMGELVLVYHNMEADVPGARMDELLADMRSRPFTHVFAFGFGGAKLSAMHRKQLVEITKDKQIVTIVDNAITRGIVTALGWFGINVKSFSRKDIRKAIESLDVAGLTPDEIEAETKKFAEMCEKIGAA